LTLAFSSPSLAKRFVDDVSGIVAKAVHEVVGVELRLTAKAGDVSVAAPAAAAKAAEPEVTAEDIEDSEDLDESTAVDPEAAALALLQDGLGAQVIGEIDQS
jgi:hypothetical protein